jgi:5-methylcytosine-specific restriction endonuclease McrA
MGSSSLRRCLREPIPEIELAAKQLNDAVSAHLQGERDTAEELLRLTNNRVLWEWLDSVWGKQTEYNRPRRELKTPPVLPKELRSSPRDATPALKRLIHERDGYYCRFCKVPVIRSQVREAIRQAYPDAVPWGSTNTTQHAAFQLMWAQYDHILPHARGGQSTLENVYLTCAACNFGRGNYLLEDFDLMHPSLHPRREGDWDGLERFADRRSESKTPPADRVVEGAVAAVDFRALDLVAATAVREHRFDDALRVYLFMADSDASHDAGHLAERIGSCYEALGDFPAARYWYGHAIQENPNARLESVMGRKRLRAESYDELLHLGKISQTRDQSARSSSERNGATG